MPKVVREDIDNVSAVLTVTIEKEDYEKKYKKELKEYGSKNPMKGFRKGKVPATVLTKRFGKHTLAKVLNDILSKELDGYLREEKLPLIGQPIPTDDQVVDFNTTQLTDYTFKFDVGLAPEVDVEALLQLEVERYDVEVDEEEIDKALEMAQRRGGAFEAVEAEIETEDRIWLKGFELEGDARKEKGFETDFSVFGKDFTEEMEKEVIGKNKGDTFRADIYTMQKDTDEKFVKKYFLNLDDEEEKEIGHDFEFEIDKVERLVPAALEQEFFDKAFGENKVSNEAEAKAFIRNDMKVYYDHYADALFYQETQKAYMEAVKDIALPDTFLKKWLATSEQNDITPERIEEEYDDVSRSVRWNTIQNKLAAENNIQVSQQEIKQVVINKFKNQFAGSMGGQMAALEPMFDEYAEKMLQDDKQYRETHAQVLDNKLMKVIVEKQKTVLNPIAEADFKKMLEDRQKEIQGAAPEVAAQEEE